MDIQKNIPLAPYTTVKIGGPAQFFVHVQNTPEFLEAIKYGLENNLSITILGNGSNILISDSGIRGLVIKNDSNEIELLPDNKIKVASGVQLSQLINFALNHNLLGLEEFAYIPSTVGGAIAGNIHGIDKNNFIKFVDSIEKYNDFIISTVLNLISGDSSTAKIRVQEIIQKKSTIQSMNSLGSVFKNIPNQDPSGMIIDQKLNLKGYSIGDAQVSPLHANFIINNGQATASDYLKLIKYIQLEALEKLNLNLEPEIKFLGQF